MSAWPKLPFVQLLSDETGGNLKTLQSEYLREGQYPIIDQGEELIGGYTNDPARLCKADLPVIVFGDHTKCFKFIDFPFCLGADGTKILRPKQRTDERYLFYALQTIHIPDAGYSRHFKYLKEGKIPLPPFDEQKRIAAILDQADELRSKRQRAIDRLNQLGQAIFCEMFGDPATNPKKFPPKKLGEIIEFIGGSQPPKSQFLYENGPGRVRFVQIRDFRTDKYPTYVPSSLAKRPFTENDVMIGRYGPPVFQIFRGLAGTYNVALMKAKPKLHITSDFVFYLLQESRLHSFVVANSERTAGQSGVNLELLENYPAYAPPTQLLSAFSERILVLRKQEAQQKIAVLRTTSLFSSLQDAAFSGEL